MGHPVYKKRMMKRYAILFVAFLFALSACAKEDPEIIEKEPIDEPIVELDPKDRIDLSLKPNEAGQIMVLMYHNIGPEEKTWVRTPENFRKDLEYLYEQGFRPIRLSDYVKGHITTEAGKTPIVLTFDDANLNNFNYLEDGSIDPDSAVGILVEFNQTHPDFPLHATFFSNGANPFRQSELIQKKIDFLLANGMDIGNHSKEHMNFKDATQADLEYQLGAQVQYLQKFVPSDYTINTLALPYGSRPKDKTLEVYLQKGQYEDVSYEHIAILNVGWMPALSPFHNAFDPLSIPRVRASETDVDNVGFMNYLLDYEMNPQKRYISDGEASIITIPSSVADKLNTSLPLEIYSYE